MQGSAGCPKSLNERSTANKTYSWVTEITVISTISYGLTMTLLILRESIRTRRQIIPVKDYNFAPYT